ncbi:MAG: WecB/TagA/CpsF family glycosyltransferase [Balneolaceae bacterium]
MSSNSSKTSSKDFEILNISVRAITQNELSYEIGNFISNNDKKIIGIHNLNSIYLANNSPEIAGFYKLPQMEFSFIDGMSVVLIGRLLGYPLYRRHRLTSIDWLFDLSKLCEKNHWKIYFLGSTTEVGERAKAEFQEYSPNLKMKTHHGFFDAENKVECNTILKEIEEFKPQILIVGMGMPRQEKWIANYINKIDANVIFNWGACMDYIAGVVPTPPRWAGRWGVEWVFRLAYEPKRLYKRYLIDPWYLLPLFIKELVSKRLG